MSKTVFQFTDRGFWISVSWIRNRKSHFCFLNQESEIAFLSLVQQNFPSRGGTTDVGDVLTSGSRCHPVSGPRKSFLLAVKTFLSLHKIKIIRNSKQHSNWPDPKPLLKHPKKSQLNSHKPSLTYYLLFLNVYFLGPTKIGFLRDDF